MPLYVIERTFAEQLELTGDDVRLIDDINADEGVRWLFSFLSADRRRTYCLYEAPSPEAILTAARRGCRLRRWPSSERVCGPASAPRCRSPRTSWTSCWRRCSAAATCSSRTIR